MFSDTYGRKEMDMARQKPEYFGTCPFVTAQWVLQGKWTIVILHHLSEGTLRFSELRSRMPQLTHSTLSSQLKQLEAEGMVKRTVYPEVPPRVEYELTELGRTFQPVLDAVGSWGERYIEYLDAQEKKEGMKEDAK